jgi:hypothetical protein
MLEGALNKVRRICFTPSSILSLLIPIFLFREVNLPSFRAESR